MEKKKHVGLTVFLIVLAILIMIPASIYCYLRFSTFESEKPVVAEERGTAAVQKDGSLLIDMTGFDFQEFIADYYKEDIDQELSSYGLFTVDDTVFNVSGSELTVFADATVFNAIPLHLKGLVGFSVAEDVASFDVRQVKIGKWITLSKEKLMKYGLEDSYSFEIEKKLGTSMTSLELDGEGAKLTLKDYGFEKALSLLLLNDLYPRSRVLQFLSADVSTVPKCLLATYDKSSGKRAELGYFQKIVMKADDATEEYLRLLACAQDSTAKESMGCIVPIAQKYLFPDYEQKLEALRQVEDERINSCIEPYREMMDTVERDWCNLALLVEEDRITYLDGGEKLPAVDGLAPEQLEGDYAGIYMVDSNRSTWMVNTVGYPATKDLHLAEEQYVNRIPVAKTGVGVYLRIPDGMDMLMYRQNNGNLVLCSLPEDILETLSTHYGIPFFFEDSIVKPHTRVPAYTAPNGTMLEILIP